MIAFEGVLSVSKAFVLPMTPLTRPSFSGHTSVVMSMVDASKVIATETTFDPLTGPNSPLCYNNNDKVNMNCWAA